MFETLKQYCKIVTFQSLFCFLKKVHRPIILTCWSSQNNFMCNRILVHTFLPMKVEGLLSALYYFLITAVFVNVRISNILLTHETELSSHKYQTKSNVVKSLWNSCIVTLYLADYVSSVELVQRYRSLNFRAAIVITITRLVAKRSRLVYMSGETRVTSLWG